MYKLKIELRAITKFFYLRDYAIDQIYNEICSLYETEAISKRSIYNYFESLDNGTFSIFDKNHIGRPKNIENIEKVKEYASDNPSTTTREIERDIKINKSLASVILRENLNMKKV